MFDFKYAEYIVPAFAVTAVVFTGMVGFTLSRARHWKRRYRELAGK
jgi:heme exporter protein CcmD